MNSAQRISKSPVDAGGNRESTSIKKRSRRSTQKALAYALFNTYQNSIRYSVQYAVTDYSSGAGEVERVPGDKIEEEFLETVVEEDTNGR